MKRKKREKEGEGTLREEVVVIAIRWVERWRCSTRSW